MSLLLDQGTVPESLEVKTWGIGGLGIQEVVFIGDYRVSMLDFLAMVFYVLTNTDLTPNDPRRQFVRCVAAMHETEGYNSLLNSKAVRLTTPIEPFLPTTPVDEVKPSPRRKRKMATRRR